MLVMGIDPGIAITGYGLVQPGRQGSGKAIAYGCVRTPARTPLADRLSLLYEIAFVRVEKCCLLMLINYSYGVDKWDTRVYSLIIRCGNFRR